MTLLFWCQPWRASALGIPHLRPRSRTPRLGPAIRGRGGFERGRRLRGTSRMSPVQERGPLRAPVAGLWACGLHGRRRAHSRFRTLRPRLLGEDSQVLGRDAAPSRDARFQAHLPLLLHGARLAGLDATHLPGPDRLTDTPQKPTTTVTGRDPSVVPAADVEQRWGWVWSRQPCDSCTHSVCMSNGVAAIVNAAQGTSILHSLYPFPPADWRWIWKTGPDVCIFSFRPNSTRLVQKGFQSNVYRSLKCCYWSLVSDVCKLKQHSPPHTSQQQRESFIFLARLPGILHFSRERPFL